MEITISNDFFQNKILKNTNQDIKGIIDKEIKQLQFLDADFKNTINYDVDKFTFIRENSEYKFVLDFITKVAYLDLKKYTKVDIKVISAEFEISNNKIMIEYRLESDEDSLITYIIELRDETL